VGQHAPIRECPNASKALCYPSYRLNLDGRFATRNAAARHKDEQILKDGKTRHLNTG
jgi:hypothetical protein